MKIPVKKILLLGSLGLTLFFIVSLILAISLINPNDYKDNIQNTLSEVSGHKVTIPGDIELKLFPRLNLSIEQINIHSHRNKRAENDSGKPSKRRDTLDIKTYDLKLHIQLLSLFSGEPKIGEVFIKRSTITIGSDKKNTAKKHQLNNITLSSSGFKPDHKTSVSANFKYTLPNKKTFPVYLNTDVIYHSQNQAIQFSDLQLKLAMVKITGDVALTPTGKQYKVSGTTHIKTFSIRKLAKIFATPLPDMANNNALNKFAFSGQFTLQNNLLSLTKITAQLDNTFMRGKLSAFLKPDYPVTFNLRADRLNVDDYRIKTQQATTSNSVAVNDKHVPSTSTTKSHEPQTKPAANPFAVLAINLNGALTLDKLVFNNLHTQHISLNFKTRNKTITLTSSSRLYSGSHRGKLRLTQKRNSLVLSGQQHLTNVELEPLLKDYMKEAYASGKAILEFNFQTNGKNSDSLLKNMQGNGKINLKESELKTIKLEKALINDPDMNKNFKSFLKRISKGQNEDKKITVFDRISASFTIANGIVRNNDLTAVSSRARVTGSGDINLLNQSLDYKAFYHYNKSHIVRIFGTDLDLKDKPIGIYMQGTLKEPVYDIKSKPLTKALEREYKDKRKQRNKEKLDKEKHKLEDKLKNKLKDLFK